ncbi:MAG: PAS domain S-box protein [Paludibacter sp.]
MKIIKKKIENLRQKAVQLVETQPNHSTSFNTIEAELLKTVDLLEVHQIELESQNEELHQAKLAAQDAIDLYDFAPIGYFSLSNLGEIVNLNLCGAEMLCKERSLAKNSLFANVVSDDTKHIFYNFLDRVFSSTVQETSNVTITANCSSRMYLHLTGIIAKDEKQCLITAVDFSDFKLEHEKLQQSEVRYRSVFENVQDAYYEASLDGILIDISPSIETISKGQYTRNELIGKPFAGIYAEPEARDNFFSELFKTGRVIDHELLLNNKDGSIIPVAVSSLLITDANGLPVKITGSLRDISKRKLAENAYLESELKYRTLANSGQALIWTSDLDMGCYYFNQVWLNFTGRTLEQELGNGWAEGVHQDDLDRCLNIYTTAFNKQESFSMIYRLRRHDGEFRWLIDEGTPRYNSLGEFIGYIGHCLDITERQLAEDALFLSNQKWETIIAASPYGIGMVGLDGKIQLVSDKLASMYGYSVDEKNQFIGNSVLDFIDPSDHNKVKGNINRLINHEVEHSVAEYLSIKKDLSEFTIELNSTILYNNGKPESILYIQQDITERKLSEKKLQESEALYHSILMASPDSIAITDLEGNILFVSPKTLIMFGYESTDDLLNINLNNFILLEDRERIQIEIARMHQGIFTGSAEYKAIHSDKSIFDIDVNAEFIRNYEGVPTKMVFIVRDITGRKKAERLRDQQLFYSKALNEIAEIIISNENADEILEKVNNVLGITLQVDRTLIYNVLFDKKEIEGLCEWLRFDHPEIATTKGVYPLEMFKNPFSALWNSRQAIVSQFDAVNEHFTEDGSGVILHQQMNIKSLLWYPFRFQENGCHVFTLNQILEPRQWTAEDINFLESVGKQVNLALEKISFLDERKIAQQELETSEERFRQVVEQSREVVWEVDAEGLYTYVSPMAIQIYGYKPEQMVGKLHFYDLWPEVEEHEQFKTNTFEVFQNKESIHNLINAIIKPDGSECILSTNGIPIISESGNLMGYRGLDADITERINAEIELRKLSQAVEQSPVSIVITNTLGKIEYANPKISEITGYTNDYLVGKNPRVLSSGEKHIDEYHELWETISSGKDWRGEFHNKKKNGELYWASALITPISDVDGKITHYLSIEEDITDRKLIEQKIIELNETLEQKVKERTLQLALTNSTLTKEIDKRKRIQDALSKSENNYRTVVENVNDVIFQTDTQGLWVFLNKSWEVITGFGIEESLGQLFANFVHPDDREQNMKLFEPLILREKEYYRHTVRYLTKDGGFRWIEVFARLGLNENDEITGTYGTLQDITERKQSEELLLWNKSLLELMSNSSPLGFLVVDNRTDDILYFNQRFCQIWGIEQLMEQMHNGEFKNNDIIPYCLPVLADIPAFAASCSPLQDEDNRIIMSDEIPFTEHRTIHRYTTQIRGNNDEYYGRFYIFEDITERKRAEEFEDELLQLSIQMNGIADSEISNAINNALSKIGSFLDVDRVFIFELKADNATMDNTYEWCNEGIGAEIANRKGVPVDVFPMCMNALKHKKNVIITDVKELPKSWSTEREILETNGILSLINIPISSNNTLIGFVGLDAVSQKKEYNESEINSLMVWSNMLAGILNKQRNDLNLNQTRQNYETFFNTIDDFLFVLDEKGNMLHTNKLVVDRLEYTTEELIYNSVLMVHPVERREEAGRIVGEMLAGTAEFCPVPLFTKSGKSIPVETRVKPGFWDGKPMIFGVSKDISKIQLSEEKFSKAFHSSSALMAITGYDDDVFIDVNDIFLKKLEYSRDEIIGKSSTNLTLFEDLVLDRSQKLNKEIQIRDVELQLNPKSGEALTGLVSTEKIYVGEKLCILTLIIDITERKRAEEDTRKARLEAEKANMAKSEFLSRMSHELRTPLNSILGFAQLLGMGDLNPKQERSVDHILNSGNHLLTLIDEVLDISRIEAGRLSLTIEPVQLKPIIEEIMDSVQPLVLAKQLTLILNDTPGNEQFVLCDKKALKQILINLLNNAVKYNREGGTITVKTKLRQETEGGKDVVQISINDTGLGIDQDQIPKLFIPFERIGAESTHTEGTGLGLAVVKKLMDAMEGEFGVDSTVGKGSNFWIQLPLSENHSSWKLQIEKNERLSEALISVEKELLYQNDEKAKRASELDIANVELAYQKEEKVKRASELNSANIELAYLNDEKAKRASELDIANVELAYQKEEKVKRANELNDANKKIATLKHDAKHKTLLKTILYIEDNVANVELVDQILKSQRREIHLISNEKGKLATNLAIEYAPDLILLDLNLPDIHGSEVLRLLQENEETRDIPVVVISSDAMPLRTESLISAGAKRYLTKPLEVMSFLSVINEFIKY